MGVEGIKTDIKSMEAKLGMSVTEQEDQYSQELEDQEMEMAGGRLCDFEKCRLQCINGYRHRPQQEDKVA